MPTFYEFFAGGGMARAGLGPGWECLFANDIDQKKAASYAANWTDETLKIGDVGSLSTLDLPGAPDLIWASFPCQDLSLAGNYLGLKGERSGTFWPFWELVRGLRTEQRNPALIVLENVCGALTSHKGRDFQSIVKSVRDEDYNVGALVVDAAQFVPQSRPRLFIVAVRSDMPIPDELKLDGPRAPFHTAAIEKAHSELPAADNKCWIWWNLPVAPRRTKCFSDVMEDGALWHSESQTRALLDLMLPLHRAKVSRAKKMNTRVIGTIYKRTRPDDEGIKAQRAEVRFDEIAGCLRTPGGGSSRQSIIIVEGNNVRSRLLTPREAARLMGLNEDYVLPENYNEAYHLMGDGVVVPVVSHIANNLLSPVLENAKALVESVA
jgi:DNA (cytosine-5)-methyltransferase 1